MGRWTLNRQLGRWTGLVLGAAYLGCLGLGLYEMTAKSPTLLGKPLPGWWASVKAEKSTRWNPPTGILPVDKFLHEGEEAVRFYRFLVQPVASVAPVSATVS